jgi:hypothetical protein
MSPLPFQYKNVDECSIVHHFDSDASQKSSIFMIDSRLISQFLKFSDHFQIIILPMTLARRSSCNTFVHPFLQFGKNTDSTSLSLHEMIKTQISDLEDPEESEARRYHRMLFKLCDVHCPSFPRIFWN